MAGLRIRAAEPRGDSYRAEGEVLELALTADVSAHRPSWVPAFLVLLGVVVVSTGVMSHTPAISGAGALFFVLALALVLSRPRRSAWVRVDGDRVRARCAGTNLDVPRREVVDLGIGQDGSARTLWLDVRGQGRCLAMEGLDPGDAERGAMALREVLFGGRA